MRSVNRETQEQQATQRGSQEREAWPTFLWPWDSLLFAPHCGFQNPPPGVWSFACDARRGLSSGGAVLPRWPYLGESPCQPPPLP